MKSMQAILLVIGVISIGVALAADQRAGRRIASEPANFKSPCGTATQLSKRGGECLRPIFELIEGKFPKPSSDLDAQSSCARFNATSRCIRQVAKDCLSGIHKASVGAVASATRRFYTSECKSVESRAPYLEPLKCALVNGPQMRKVYESYTAIMQGARDLPIPPEEKIIKMCCVLNELDTEISKVFDKNCPKSTPLVLKLIHAITDDARNTLCLNPKCQGALDGLRNHKYTPPQNLIEPIQEILFQISV